MARKQKVTVKKKVKIVQECIDKKVSISEAAREAGVDRQATRSWINVYENQGIEGSARKGDRHYSIEVKTAAVVEYLHGGGSMQTICKKYQIQNKRQLSNRVKVYTASISIPSFLLICGYPALSKVRTYSIVKREPGPNLLNRALNDGGWLTHLSAGVMSQSGISSDRCLHHKGKEQGRIDLTLTL